MFRRIISLVVLSLLSTLSLNLQAARDDRYESYVARQEARWQQDAPSIAAWQAQLEDPFKDVLDYAGIPAPIKGLFTRAGIRSDAQRVRLGQLVALMNMEAPEKYNQAFWLGYFQEATTVGALRAIITDTVAVANAVIATNFPKFRAQLIPFLEVVVPQLNDLLEVLSSLDADAPITIINEAPALDGDYDCGGGDFDFVEPKESVFQFALRVARTHKSTVAAAGATALGFVVAGTCYPILLPAMAVSCGMGATLGGSMALARSLHNKRSREEVVEDVTHGVVMGGFGGMMSSVAAPLVPAPWFATTFAPVALESATEGALVGFMTGAVAGLDHDAVLRNALYGTALGGALGGLFGQMREWYANYAAASKTAVDLRTRIAELQGNVTALETFPANDMQVAAINDQHAAILAQNEQLKIVFNAANEQVKQFGDNSRALVVYRPGDELIIDVVKKQVDTQQAQIADLYRLINENDSVIRDLTDRMVAAERARAEAAAHALMVVPQHAQPMCLPMCQMDEAPIVLPTCGLQDTLSAGIWSSAKTFVEGAFTGADTGFWARAKDRVADHLTGPDLGFWSRAKDSVRTHLPFGWK